MSIEELKAGKCYRTNSIFGVCLFKIDRFIDEDEDNPYWKYVVTKIICVTKDTIGVEKRGYVPISEEYEEVDESILDKAIKQFNMDKAAISVIINQDKSNETQGNTTQGDYQLP